MTAPTGSDPPGLCLRLLGPLEVVVNGQPLPPVHTRKALWLLVLLILREGQVARDWLAATLWPDSDNALYNLRQALNDLRRALGKEGYRLLSPTPRSLSLDLTSAQVDLREFDQAIAAGDLASLERAVDLYRGPLLEGCLEEWALPERERREQALLDALDTLAQQALAHKDAETAVRHLRRAVALDPLREGAQRGLMLALAASGNYAAATQAYRDLRLMLHQELNTEPSPETVRLYQRIRQDARAAARESVHPSAPDRGERAASSLTASRLPLPPGWLIGREQELEHVGGYLASSRLVTLTGPGGVGKTRLMLQLAHETAQGYPDGAWLVELASVGDPSLVWQTVAQALGVQESPGRSLSESVLEALSPRQMLLALDNCEHLVEACAEVAEALLERCPDVTLMATSREPLQVMGERVYQVPPLAVPEEGVELEALQECASVRLFLERAEQQGGLELTLESVGPIGQVCQQLEGIPLAIELAAARARAMPLAELAARLSHRFDLLRGGRRTSPLRHRTLEAALDWSYELLNEEERRVLRALSVFAGGWTLEAAEAVCAEEPLTLTQGSQTMPPTLWRPYGQRLQSVGTLVWDGRRERAQATPQSETEREPTTPLSEREMEPATSPPDREMERVSSLSLWERGGGEDAPILDHLTTLVDKSLVLFQRETGRYRLLETVRQYASERLKECGKEDAVHDRHLLYFLAFAELADTASQGPEQGAWLDRLEGDHANLRVALSRCAHTSDHQARLAAVLAPFWKLRDHWQEAIGWLDQLLAPHYQTPALLWARLVLARARFDVGDSIAFEPLSMLEEAAELFHAAGDNARLAWCLARLSRHSHVRGWERAMGLADQSARIARSLPVGWAQAESLYYAAWTVWDSQDWDRGYPLMQEALQAAREAGIPFAIADAWDALAWMHYYQKQHSQERACVQQALPYARAAGTKSFIVYLLARLYRHPVGDEAGAALAEQLHEGVLAIREVQDRREMGLYLGELVHTIVRSDQLASVEASLWEASALRPEPGLIRVIGLAHLGLSRLAAARGEEEEANAQLNQAIDVVRANPCWDGFTGMTEIAGEAARRKVLGPALAACNEVFEICVTIPYPGAWEHQITCLNSMLALGDIARNGGEWDLALRWYTHRLGYFYERGWTDSAAPTLAAIAGLRLCEGSPERAAMLFGAAEALAASAGVASPIVGSEDNAKGLAAARAALGEEAFTAAFAKGQAMTLDQAVELALER